MKVSSALPPLGLLACLAWAQPALAQACPSAQAMGIRPQIEVQVEIPATSYRNDVSRTRLSRMMNQEGSNAGGHGSVLGLTHGTFAASWSIEAVSTRREGGYCHYLKHADVRLTIPSLVVYIASEYRQGTCQFQVIAKHENEHVRVNQYVVRKYAPIMKAALNRRAQEVLPLVSTGSDSAREVERALNGTVNAVLKDMYRERDRGNASIDTDYQYQRTAKECARW